MKKLLKIFVITILLFTTIVSCSKNINESTNLENLNNKISNENSNKVTKALKDEDIKEEYDTEEKIFPVEDFTNNKLDYYKIDVSLDDKNKVITGNQNFTYTNNSEVDFKSLYFHLYPNAFNKGSHPTLFDKEKDEIDGQDGSIDILSVKVNGKEVNFEVSPIDTVLKIDYDNSFLMEKTYTIEFEYDIYIPSTNERFGVAEDLYNIANWYPILAVYDEDGWNLDPYYDFGDPFYSNSSNYDITIELPKSFVVAGSGYIYKITKNDHKKKYSFRADNMRDFALSFSDKFELISKKVNDTIVFLYYPKDSKRISLIKKSISYGVDSIELFSKVIGMYPYKTYSIVITNFPSGMEYPGLVLISDKYFNVKSSSVKNVIVHETAHQWFYGIIGNDEIEEGWIDEGLTTFMTAYYDLAYGNEKAYKYAISGLLIKMKSFDGKDNVQMIKSAKDFTNWRDYGAAAYSKPALMASTLYDTYGEEAFLLFVSTLYDEYKFKIMKQDDYIKIAKKVFGEDVDEFFDKWMK